MNTKITIKIKKRNKQICNWYARKNNKSIGCFIDECIDEFIENHNLDEKFDKISERLL